MKIEHLNLCALKYFFNSVEEGSLTKAATLNNVTRSAVGQAIHRLEEWSGKSLVTHKRKQFELTSDGEDFYRQMKLSYDSFKSSVESPFNEAGNLKVGCSASLAELFLFPQLKKIGNIEKLHLVTGTSRQLRYFLDEEQIHISLSVRERILENQRILKSGNYILVSKDGRLKKTIITTETRPEVSALKTFLSKDNSLPTYLTVESWSLSLRLAQELNYACLVPDFMSLPGMKKISTPGFVKNYEIVIESLPREKLTSAEFALLDSFV
jgi:DNA-binding transcriptional LysR family regulator